MGPRTKAGHPFQQPGPSRQPGLSSRAALASSHGLWRSGDRRFRETARPVSGAEGDDRRGRPATRRGHGKTQLGLTTGLTTPAGTTRSRLHVPTVNIEGLVAGYTGPGGKTILPHRAVAKLDLRLVPDMTSTDDRGPQGAPRQARLRGHRGNITGGYDPTEHAGGRGAHSRADRAPVTGGPRPDSLAAQGRLLSRIRLHRRAARACRGPLRPRPWQRRARSGRVLRD